MHILHSGFMLLVYCTNRRSIKFSHWQKKQNCHDFKQTCL